MFVHFTENLEKIYRTNRNLHYINLNLIILIFKILKIDRDRAQLKHQLYIKSNTGNSESMLEHLLNRLFSRVTILGKYDTCGESDLNMAVPKIKQNQN